MLIECINFIGNPSTTDLNEDLGHGFKESTGSLDISKNGEPVQPCLKSYPKKICGNQHRSFNPS